MSTGTSTRASSLHAYSTALHSPVENRLGGRCRQQARGTSGATLATKDYWVVANK